MKKLLFLSSLFLVGSVVADVLPPPPATVAEAQAGVVRNKYISPYTMAQAGVGGGGVVSNYIFSGSNPVLETWYDNTTEYYAQPNVSVTLSTPDGATAAALIEVDTNGDETADYMLRQVGHADLASFLGSQSSLMSILVPPGASWRITDDSIGTTVAIDTTAPNGNQIVYFGAGGGGGSGDVTEAGLAAGDYPIDASALTGEVPLDTLTVVPDIIATNSTFPVFNVKTFGALGNGSSDDTDAILNTFAAAKAAGGGVVYFPAVTNFYPVTLSDNAGAINVTNAHNITVLGDGDASFVKNVDTVNGNVAVFKIWLSTNYTMRNIRVSGGSDVRAFASNENEGINLIFCTNGTMENVTVQDVLADAWDLDWCYGFTWYNPVSKNIGGSGWKPNGYHFTLFGGVMQNCGKTATEADRGGLVIPDAYGVSVFGTVITNCNPNIYISGANRVLIDGVHCWVTNNTITNVYIFGGTDQTISGSTFTGGYAIWTTNNIGGSTGPTGLTISENKFWTTSLLYVQTDVTDLQVYNNRHISSLNPLGSLSVHSIFLAASTRAAIQGNNIRVNGTALRFSGINHELQVIDNYFGTYASQAVYAESNAARMTNGLFANNVFMQAGVNSISFSDSLSVSNCMFTGNLFKGQFRLQGGTHYISGNKIEAGMLLYNTTCISNVIVGNHFGNTNWYAVQVPQNSFWLNNTGDASATTNNADYSILRFIYGWLNSSNTVASWPTTPRYPGDVYFAPPSNGVQYVLYSTNGTGAGTTTWTRTNYFGPN